MLRSLICILLLVVASASDLKTKTISVVIPLVGIIFSIMFIFMSVEKKIYIWGILFGLFMILISFLVKDKIGMGDGLMIMTVGGLQGIYFCMESVLIASILSAVTGIVLMLIYKAGKGFELPFIPFLLVGTTIVKVAEVMD